MNLQTRDPYGKLPTQTAANEASIFAGLRASLAVFCIGG